MLVSPYARPGIMPDRETGEINAYDLWAFVDYPAYPGAFLATDCGFVKITSRP
jgi:hypothetical protein